MGLNILNTTKEIIMEPCLSKSTLFSYFKHHSNLSAIDCYPRVVHNLPVW